MSDINCQEVDMNLRCHDFEDELMIELTDILVDKCGGGNVRY
jgi:hypothetical protein